MKRIRLCIKGDEAEAQKAAHAHGVPFMCIIRKMSVTVGEAVFSPEIKAKIDAWYAEPLPDTNGHEVYPVGTLLSVGSHD